jgi:hypothetical protein
LVLALAGCWRFVTLALARGSYLGRSLKSAFSEGEDAMPHTAELTDTLRECIHNCLDCHAICTETVVHCLKIGGKHADAGHIRLLLDCGAICATSGDFMLRGSPHHVRTCGICAEICEQCADSCEALAGGDQTMLECAKICRRCAGSCAGMSQAAHGGDGR